MKLIASLLIAAALVAPALTHANEPAVQTAKADLAKGEATYAAVCASCPVSYTHLTLPTICSV